MTYTISIRDFDRSLLPHGARKPGTPEFRDALVTFIRSEYEAIGGTVRLILNESDGLIEVTWDGDEAGLDPLAAAVDKLDSGQREEGVRLLELLRLADPDNPTVLYNLGLALSDLGRLDEAIAHLQRVRESEPTNVNALVGLGVALGRDGEVQTSVGVLREAVALDADNPWARRNLGAMLLKSNAEAQEAEEHLRRAAELAPTDQQALYVLSQALLRRGEDVEADELLKKVISLNAHTPVAEMARTDRSALAQASFRARAGGAERIDAVSYCLGALELFDDMPADKIRAIGIEIAILGQRGLDTNDTTRRHTLHELPGQFSALHLLCIMYVAFQIIEPTQDIGFDLSREYRTALSLHRND